MWDGKGIFRDNKNNIFYNGSFKRGCFHGFGNLSYKNGNNY